uniref:rRNA N-glycosylase n=1 Tax=Aegilops tauschii TaxID=37682 RepID=N1QW99_AEGTA
MAATPVKPAKNVDKPLFTATFNVQSSSADYVTFLTGIRNKLGNPGHFSHNRPVLPPVEPNVAPNRWFHIVLKTATASTGLTLATRRQPLLGGLQEQRRHLVGGWEMADAVTALYGRTKADKTSGPKQQQAREAVTTLLLMVHEATRFQSVSAFVADLLHPKALEKKSGKIGDEMKAQVNGWQELSEALLKTDVKPPPGKPPAKFTPIEKMGVRTAEQAAATLGILLLVEVPGGLTVAEGLQLFRASGGK